MRCDHQKTRDASYFNVNSKRTSSALAPSRLAGIGVRPRQSRHAAGREEPWSGLEIFSAPFSAKRNGRKASCLSPKASSGFAVQHAEEWSEKILKRKVPPATTLQSCASL